MAIEDGPLWHCASCEKGASESHRGVGATVCVACGDKAWLALEIAASNARETAAVRERCKTFAEWQHDCYEQGKSKGWYNGEPDVPERLLQIVGEVAEATRAHDRGVGNLRFVSVIDGKPEGFPAELIDIVIRVMNLASDCGIDLEEQLRMKYKYNATRPFGKAHPHARQP